MHMEVNSASQKSGQEQIVEALEAALQRANAGEMAGIVIVSTTREGAFNAKLVIDDGIRGMARLAKGMNDVTAKLNDAAWDQLNDEGKE